jgi:hypothetical protein
MPFKKGIATNPKGKKPGTLNETTKDIKAAYKLLIENNLDNLTGWLEKIADKDPEKAIRIISDLMEFVIPKLARTDLTSGDKPLQEIPDVSKLSEDELSKFAEISRKLRG